MGTEKFPLFGDWRLSLGRLKRTSTALVVLSVAVETYMGS